MPDATKPTVSDDKSHDAKAVDCFYVVHLSGGGFVVHSQSESKAGALRVARAVDGFVLTLVKGE